ncbi:MAG: sodium:proton antiporter [Planctomycetaceae bacterium]|nr:sodium:proton antiporter [Planctomycetaceae bacterium]
MEHGENFGVALAALFLLGIAAQWIGSWLRLPSILFLLAFGIIAGPVTHFLNPDAMLGDVLFPAVSLAVAVILFEGSLNLRFRELREIGGALTSLLTIGVVITWVTATFLAHFVLGFGWLKALLLGAILVVTGPTVIGPLLRQIRPIGRVGSIARWEGIVIDPIGAVLAVLVFEAGAGARDTWLADGSMSAFSDALISASLGLMKTVIAGGGIGAVAALVLGTLLRRHALPDHLQNPITLMFVIAAFTASNLVQHESGLVAVTVMGVILANFPGIDIEHILEFKENLSVLLISGLFILLSARLNLDAFNSLGWRGAVFLAGVILIVRPLSVWLSTYSSSLTWQEKVFLSWFAPRGIVAAAVSSVFALRMGDDGTGLVPATFLVIIGTVCVYGFTAFALARKLGLAVENPQGVLIAGAHAGVRAIAHALQNAGFQVLLVDLNHWNIQTARMEGLPTSEGNILSERLLENLNLGGIGRFLAMTPNDEVNSLAALNLRGLFGRAEVFQLFPRRRSERQEAASQSVRARFLFGEDITNQRLNERFEHGSTVKTTKLTEEFDYEAFQQRYAGTAILLFVIGEGGQLRVVTTDEKLSPKPGQTVIAIVDPVESLKPEDVGEPSAASDDT